MATIVKNGKFISITGIAADVAFNRIFNEQTGEDVRIKRLEFCSTVNNDYCTIKNKTDTGAVITRLGSNQASESAKTYFHDDAQYMQPMVDLSASVLNGDHILKLELA